MSLLLNEEQRLLRDTAREFLGARSPVSALRQLRDTRDALGYVPALWREVVDMGWTAACSRKRAARRNATHGCRV